jgi:hypothetical protein
MINKIPHSFTFRGKRHAWSEFEVYFYTTSQCLYGIWVYHQAARAGRQLALQSSAASKPGMEQALGSVQKR